MTISYIDETTDNLVACTQNATYIPTKGEYVRFSKGNTFKVLDKVYDVHSETLVITVVKIK